MNMSEVVGFDNSDYVKLLRKFIIALLTSVDHYHICLSENNLVLIERIFEGRWLTLLEKALATALSIAKVESLNCPSATKNHRFILTPTQISLIYSCIPPWQRIDNHFKRSYFFPNENYELMNDNLTYEHSIKKAGIHSSTYGLYSKFMFFTQRRFANIVIPETIEFGGSIVYALLANNSIIEHYPSWFNYVEHLYPINDTDIDIRINEADPVKYHLILVDFVKQLSNVPLDIFHITFAGDIRVEIPVTLEDLVNMDITTLGDCKNKYKITTPLTQDGVKYRDIDIYYGKFAQVNSYHLPCVRASLIIENGMPKIYAFPAFATSIITGVVSDFNMVLSFISNPIEIILKYFQRGVNFILSNKEMEQIEKYTLEVQKWRQLNKSYLNKRTSRIFRNALIGCGFNWNNKNQFVPNRIHSTRSVHETSTEFVDGKMVNRKIKC